MTPRHPATAASYLERINRAIDHVVTRLDQPLRLRDLARAAALSPFHFHRVFQAIVGETPADFVKRLRLERALGLMARPDRASLTTIALDCGFASSSDFSRCFRRRYGVPPRAFDIDGWRRERAGALRAMAAPESSALHAKRLPARSNPDAFAVRIREIPARTVAYIRVDRPYQGDAVLRATKRLIAWAERHGFADNQWLGFQWDNPEITSLGDCRYYAAVTADHFTPKGEIGRYRFPPMIVARIDIRGDINLELRALQWLYGAWLPRSGYAPDDQPGFEAWEGRPFAHGLERFELGLELPVRRVRQPV